MGDGVAATALVFEAATAGAGVADWLFRFLHWFRSGFDWGSRGRGAGGGDFEFIEEGLRTVLPGGEESAGGFGQGCRQGLRPQSGVDAKLSSVFVIISASWSEPSCRSIAASR